MHARFATIYSLELRQTPSQMLLLMLSQLYRLHFTQECQLLGELFSTKLDKIGDQVGVGAECSSQKVRPRCSS